MTSLYFVMGPTCAGKSTFLEYAKRKDDRIGLVEVGKMMRAKYPPGYFKGQAAPTHTREESWDMCYKKIREHIDAQCRVILVDGQPRSIEQVEKCDRHFQDCNKYYFLLDCTIEIRRERAIKRCKTPEDYDLAEQRLTNDMLTYYTVLVELLRKKININPFDTSTDDWMENLNTRIHQ